MSPVVSAGYLSPIFVARFPCCCLCLAAFYALKSHFFSEYSPFVSQDLLRLSIPSSFHLFQNSQLTRWVLPGVLGSIVLPKQSSYKTLYSAFSNNLFMKSMALFLSIYPSFLLCNIGYYWLPASFAFSQTLWLVCFCFSDISIIDMTSAFPTSPKVFPQLPLSIFPHVFSRSCHLSD